MDEFLSARARRGAAHFVSRVLVIDDDLRIHLALEAALTEEPISLERYSGGELIEIIASVDPHLILLDVHLGWSDAFCILRNCVPRTFGGVISVMSSFGLGVVLEVMKFGESRGFRMCAPLLKPLEADSVRSVLASANELFERRSITQSARAEEAAALKPISYSLSQALASDALEVWYQPKFAIDTIEMTGAEALIRARTPSGELVMPSVLLKDATREEIIELTDRVVKQAIADTFLLAARGLRFRLSVNVPISYLVQSDPPRLLREAAMRPEWPGMIFEITEDEALGDLSDVNAVASQLRLYLVDLSIDDFGAGYSSLARLRDLPFSELKLDRSFVHGCATDSFKRSICRCVLELGQDMGLTTVAEGIECEEDLEVCRSFSCDQVQGFRFAKPMPLTQLLRLATPVELEASAPFDPGALRPPVR